VSKLTLVIEKKAGDRIIVGGCSYQILTLTVENPVIVDAVLETRYIHPEDVATRIGELVKEDKHYVED
jgi:hypothetical protein